ncbi:MAG TPA: hypothetical protein VGI43_11655 [Mucilaginibacter sp.]|jgi:hypothetical protein
MKRKLLYWIFFIAVVLLLGVVVMFLWNSFLPQTAHINNINYWQALGLIVLFRILFGGFGGIWSPSDNYKPKRNLKDKLMTMDEADRQAFKEEWRKRCAGRNKPE